MTKTQVEVITSVQRRRRWSRAEKERIVAAAIAPGAVASEVARKAGIHRPVTPAEAVDEATIPNSRSLRASEFQTQMRLMIVYLTGIYV
jgi:transposase